MALAIAAFGSASLLAKQFGLWVLIPIALLLALFEWLTVRITLVEPG